MTMAPLSDIVTVDLTQHPPQHPLGMLLAPGAGGGAHPPASLPDGAAGGPYFARPPSAAAPSPASSRATLVAGWEHGHGGRHLGPVQRSGLVRLGDRLVRINGRDVTAWTFREVMDALRACVRGGADGAAPPPSRRLRTLGFAPAGTAEWSRGTAPPAGAGAAALSESLFFGLFAPPSRAPSAAHVVHSKSRYSFVSFVGDWRVATSESDNEGPPQPQQQHTEESNDDDDDGQQLSQHSDHSTSELERQLNQEPSIKYGIDDSNPPLATAAATPTAAAPAEGDGAPAETKPFVQYEIQCHMLFRDPSAFQSHAAPQPPYGHAAHHPHGGNSVHHQSWSVWKRFSELQSMDEALRRDIGWRLDALDDGRGVAFPGARGLESWWHASGWGRVYAPDAAVAAADGGACPFPAAFLRKRQQELSSYWTSLMRIEEIFEFGDLQSHKFGKAMAAFLGVDAVLRSRKGGTAAAEPASDGPPPPPPSSRPPPPAAGSAFPAIDENESADIPAPFGPAPLRPLPSFGSASSPDRLSSKPAREVSTRLMTHDDDVSILSDGTSNAMTGASHAPRGSPMAVVDIVSPATASASVASGNRRRRSRAAATAAPRAKPAFQRQLLPP